MLHLTELRARLYEARSLDGDTAIARSGTLTKKTKTSVRVKVYDFSKRFPNANVQAVRSFYYDLNDWKDEEEEHERLRMESI